MNILLIFNNFTGSIHCLYAKATMQKTFLRGLIIALCLLTSKANCQGIIPTVGDNFWLGFLNNFTGGTDPGDELRLFISGATATTGTVDIPLQGWSTTFNVTPGVTTTLVIPNNVAEHYTNDVVDTRGIHVTTNDPVSLFAINFQGYTADAAKILPVQSIGTDYIVSSYTGLLSYQSEFLIVATEDGTEIEIIPSVNTQGGHPAGVPYIINLDQGESYQVKSTTALDELTGTIVRGTAVSGDCRPFAVFGGSQCTNIPVGCTACDHIFDQMFPSDTWGTEYLAVPFMTTTGHTYKVIARDNGTQVSINGGAPTILNAGQWLENNNVNTPTQVVANQPISVVQYMQGTSCSGTGDPAMLVLNAEDQKIDNVTFSTVQSTVITSHMLNVVVATPDIPTTQLDGAPIAPASFNPFPSDPTKSYAQLNITAGSHSLSAPNGVTGYVYGTGSAESYAYSVGSYSTVPVPPVDSALCVTDTTTLVAPITLFNPYWVAQSDTTVVIGTGAALTLYPPIISDIYTVHGNSTVSGCDQEYSFSVTVLDPPIIDLISPEDTVCMFTDIPMSVNFQTNPGLYNYDWAPAHHFDDPNSPNPVMTAQESRWYYVTVSSIGTDCISVTDSVYVHVSGGGIGMVDALTDQANMCVPDTAQLSFDVQKIEYFEDFNGGNDPGLWNSVTGATNSPVCGFIVGDALLFDGGGTRIAETVDMDVSNGGEINFYIKVANGVAPCDDAEPGEDILFQYSTNGGGTWITIQTLLEFSYPNLTYLSIAIPGGAQTASTRFRWVQPVFTGANEDVWLLENLSILVNDATGLNFAWTPAGSLSDPLSATPDAFPTVPTWYHIDINDGNCLYSDSVFIDVDPGFTLTTTNDTILCAAQLTTLSTVPSAGTGHTYSWTPNQFVTGGTSNSTLQVTPTQTTMYYVTVQSSQGCTMNDSVLVTSNSTTLNLVPPGDLCFGQTDTIFANLTTPVPGNFTFDWYDEQNQLIGTGPFVEITPTDTAMYYVTVTDTVGNCPFYDSVSVNVIDFMVNAGNDTTICNTFGFQLQGTTDATNPTYSWTQAAYLDNALISNPTIQIDSTLTYILTVDDGTCSINDTITVSNINASPLNLPTDTMVCEGTSFTLDLSNTSNIVWTPQADITNPTSTSPVFTPTQDSVQYVVTFDDQNGCALSDTIDVLLNYIPVVTLSNDTTVCVGEPVTINSTVTGTNLNYLWNTTETTTSITTTTANTYWLDVTNECGTGSDTMIMSNFVQPVLDLGNDTTLCPNSTITLTVPTPPGGLVTWSTPPNGNSLVISTAGTYWVEVRDSNLCTVSDTINVMYHPVTPVSLGPDITMCDNDTTILDASTPNGVIYQWSNGDTGPTTAIYDSAIVYVDVQDVNGCWNSDTVQINEITSPSPQIVGPAQYCEYDTVSYNVQAIYNSYEWSTGDSGVNQITVSGPVNEISIYVEDAQGCFGFDTMQVYMVVLPNLDLGDDIVLCDTMPVQLDATIQGASQYDWTTAETTPTISAGLGSYGVTVTYQNCLVSDSIFISMNEIPFDLGPDLYICLQDQSVLSHTSMFIDSIIWSDGTNSFHYYFDGTEYDYTVDSVIVSATAFGCNKAYDSVTIHLEDCDCPVYVPNAFTPNGDEHNNVFQLEHTCTLTEFSFFLYNRWGEVIFEAHDPHFQWDGTFNGNYVQDGTYVWRMEYNITTNPNTTQQRKRVGHLNMVR